MLIDLKNVNLLYKCHSQLFDACEYITEVTFPFIMKKFLKLVHLQTFLAVCAIGICYPNLTVFFFLFHQCHRQGVHAISNWKYIYQFFHTTVIYTDHEKAYCT